MPESDNEVTDTERRPVENAQGRLSLFTLVGLAIVLLPAAPAFSYWSLFFWPAGGNQYGANELAVFTAIVSLILLTPLCAVTGMLIVYKNCSWRLIRVLSWVFMIPAIATLIYIAGRFILGFDTLDLW